MRTYPADFPCASIDSFSASVLGGALRFESPVHNTARRIFNTMPHTFTLGFVMNAFTWTRWNAWMQSYGAEWFEINLPSMYAGLVNKRISPHKVRIVSGMTAVPITDKYVQVTATFELSPAMIKEYLENKTA